MGQGNDEARAPPPCETRADGDRFGGWRRCRARYRTSWLETGEGDSMKGNSAPHAVVDESEPAEHPVILCSAIDGFSVPKKYHRPLILKGFLIAF